MTIEKPNLKPQINKIDFGNLERDPSQINDLLGFEENKTTEYTGKIQEENTEAVAFAEETSVLDEKKQSAITAFLDENLLPLATNA